MQINKGILKKRNKKETLKCVIQTEMKRKALGFSKLHDWDLNAYGDMTLEMFISMMCITNIYVICCDWTMYPWLIPARK